MADPLVTVNDAAAAAFAGELLNRLNAGSGPGYFRFYTGTKPAGPDVALSGQTLLATLTCSDPAGTVSGRRLTFAAISDDVSIDTDGTPTWARGFDSAGTAVLDLWVTAAGGGGALQFNTVGWVIGGEAHITSFYIDF